MILSKSHPTIMRMGEIQIGKTLNVCGMQYEIIDQDFSQVEMDLINPLMAWKKKKKR